MWYEVVGNVISTLIIPSLLAYKSYIEIRSKLKEQKKAELEEQKNRPLKDGKSDS